MTINDAITQGNATEFVRLLNQSEDVNLQDEQGWTLLNWAAGAGNTEFVKLLIEKGADVFRCGRDNRTPYQIALAAGQIETVKYLREAEERCGGDLKCTSSRQEERRAYCRAYPASSLRAFPSWDELALESNESLSDNDIVFLHQDFTVTRSVVHGANVLHAAPTPEWRHFCVNTLGFKVPADLDLLGSI
jgi:uncharacterized protein